MTEIEHRCFIGGLSWSTTDKGLQNAFGKFGHLTEAKVAMDRYSGRSRGFGFVTFEDKQSMEDAIEEMNGVDLDGRTITVEKGQPQRSGGRDRGDPGYDRYRGRDYGGRSFGGGGGSGGDGCFTCGKIGHFARECPSGDGGRGDRYGSREDKYGGREDKYGGREDKYGGREDKYGGREDKYGGREDRYGGREDKYGGGGSGRYGSDRGDRYGGGGRSREGRSGDRYGRDRSAPYDRYGSGGHRM